MSFSQSQTFLIDDSLFLSIVVVHLYINSNTSSPYLLTLFSMQAMSFCCAVLVHYVSTSAFLANSLPFNQFSPLGNSSQQANKPVWCCDCVHYPLSHIFFIFSFPIVSLRADRWSVLFQVWRQVHRVTVLSRST